MGGTFATEVLAGLMLGAAGSIHCVVMCGPLIVALRPVRGPVRATLYHTARLATYAGMGLLAGVAGSTLAFAGLGRALSAAAGILLLVMAAARITGRVTPRVGLRFSGLLTRAMSRVGRLAGDRPVAGVMMAGAVNALLPCGLVYAALTGAAALGSAPRAFVFMIAFGVGTLPALAAASLTIRAMPLELRSRMRFGVPVALAIVGILLIVRSGLGTSPPDTAVAASPHHFHSH